MNVERRPTASSEIRCVCHRLLARITDRGVVLRCPRCKRETVLALDGREHGAVLEVHLEK